MKKIKLTQSQFALIDDEDFERINKFKWIAAYNKSNKNYYAYRYSLKVEYKNNKRYMIFMHREIMNCPDNMIVDHENHQTLDNQKHNLRICTYSQNQMNSKPIKNKISKYKGVYWVKVKKKWVTQIRINNKNKHLGYFYNEKNAAKKYNEFAIKVQGKFAYLNQI